ncbi:MAG: hypothetical protein J1F63_05835 [Oscillospiraceae bacterium]|nr:hypothetical protein [Oscillospiraceae bacterium]
MTKIANSILGKFMAYDNGISPDCADIHSSSISAGVTASTAGSTPSINPFTGKAESIAAVPAKPETSPKTPAEAMAIAILAGRVPGTFAARKNGSARRKAAAIYRTPPSGTKTYSSPIPRAIAAPSVSPTAYIV